MKRALRHAVWALALVGWASGAQGEVPDGPADAEGHLGIVAVAPGYAGRADSEARWILFLDGFIDDGATLRLARLLERQGIHGAVVYLNSPGGHLVEAMALGRMLRSSGCDTSVGARAADGVQPRAGRCYSACPFAYAGGVHRSLEPGSTLGVHRAENSVPVPDGDAFQDRVLQQSTEYLDEMGVSTGLLTLVAGAPHDAIREISVQEAEGLHLVTPPARAGEASRGAGSP